MLKENLSPIDYLVNSSPEELNRNSINKILQPIFDKLFNQGLKPEDRKRRVVIHTLRHTFASQLISKGADITWVSKMLGHKDITITLKVYTKFIKEDDDVRLEKIVQMDKFMIKLEN